MIGNAYWTLLLAVALGEGTLCAQTSAGTSSSCKAPLEDCGEPGLRQAIVHRTAIDSEGNVGDGNSITTGGDGLGLISYRGDVNGFKVAHCNDAACSSATITSHTSMPPPVVTDRTSITTGTDGLGLITYHTQGIGFGDVKVAHCNNADCSSASSASVVAWEVLMTSSITIGSDGLGLISFIDATANEIRVAHCNNLACSSAASFTIEDTDYVNDTSITIGSDGLGLISYSAYDHLKVAHCGNATCSSATIVTFAENGNYPSITRGSDGLGLISYVDSLSGDLMVAHCNDVVCSSASIATIDDTGGIGAPSITRGSDGLGLISYSGQELRAAHCNDVVCSTATLATVDGTGITIGDNSITVGADGLGLISYHDQTNGDLKVAHCPDLACLPYGGAPPPALSVGDAEAIEGNSGVMNAVFTVSLSEVSGRTVTVSYSTADGTALAGSDFATLLGALTFADGRLTQTISVRVLGDTLDEPNERFYLNLSNPVHATILDGNARGTILDDDCGTIEIAELTHGFDLLSDLAPQPGPTTDVDLYELLQHSRSSYEVVVDGTSGDIGAGAGPTLDLLALDGNTVLQSSSAIGRGPSRSLRVVNTTALAREPGYVRVRSASCATDCGAGDVYRIRAYETTYTVPRFNNSGTQITVFLLQNPTDYEIRGNVYFWDTSGTLVAAQGFDLSAKQTLVLNTPSISGASGASGTMTISHDGRYGDLAGETVALEPSTGFSFDTPMAPRVR